MNETSNNTKPAEPINEKNAETNVCEITNAKIATDDEVAAMEAEQDSKMLTNIEHELKRRFQCTKEEDEIEHRMEQCFVKGIPAAFEEMLTHGMLETAFTASVSQQLIDRLLQQLPLTPLQSIEEDPDEWQKVDDGREDNEDNENSISYQNTRCTSVFRNNNGTYTEVEGPTFRNHTYSKDGACFTTSFCSTKTAEIFDSNFHTLNLLPYRTAHEVMMPYMPELKESYGVYNREWYDAATYDAYQYIVNKYTSHDMHHCENTATTEKVISITPIWVPYNRTEPRWVQTFMGFSIAAINEDTMKLTNHIIGDTFDLNTRLDCEYDLSELFKSLPSKFYTKYIRDRIVGSPNDYFSWWLVPQRTNYDSLMSKPFPIQWFVPTYDDAETSSVDRNNIQKLLKTTCTCHLIIDRPVTMHKAVIAESLDNSLALCEYPDVKKVLSTLSEWENQARAKYAKIAPKVYNEPNNDAVNIPDNADEVVSITSECDGKNSCPISIPCDNEVSMTSDSDKVVFEDGLGELEGYPVEHGEIGMAAEPIKPMYSAEANNGQFMAEASTEKTE